RVVARARRTPRRQRARARAGDSMTIAFEAKGAGAGAAAPTSEFDQRERERFAARVRRYDELAEWRSEQASRHRYYSEQVQRLVKSLTLPNSRVLEVGCGLGD